MLHKSPIQTGQLGSDPEKAASHVPVEHVVIASDLPAVAAHLIFEINKHHPDLRCTVAPGPAPEYQLDFPETTLMIVDGEDFLSAGIEALETIAAKTVLCARRQADQPDADNDRIVLLRQPETGQLLEVVAAIVSGNPVTAEMCSPADSDRASAAPEKPKPAFTRREFEVFQGIIRGLRYKQIAAGLGLSEATVKVHAYRIFDKTGIHSKHRLASVHAAAC